MVYRTLAPHVAGRLSHRPPEKKGAGATLKAIVKLLAEMQLHDIHTSLAEKNRRLWSLQDETNALHNDISVLTAKVNDLEAALLTMEEKEEEPPCVTSEK